MASSWRANVSLITVDAMIAAVLLQFYRAGIGAPGGGSFDSHKSFGYTLLLFGIIALLILWVTKPVRPVRWIVFGAFMLMLCQPMLVYERRNSPATAALHPVNAGLILLLFFSADRTLRAARARSREAATPHEDSALSEPSLTHGETWH